MKKVTHSPWFPVSLVIAGVIVGYGLVVYQNYEVLAAWVCPNKEHCQGGNCEKNPACASGDCSKDCPGNCHEKLEIRN